MTEQIVEFETAKLAKDKGFDERTIHYYDILYTPSKLMDTGVKQRRLEYKNVVNAPTQSSLQKWLREIHNIETYVARLPNTFIDENDCPLYIGEILINGDLTPSIDLTRTDIYESSFEITLQEALKLIE